MMTLNPWACMPTLLVAGAAAFAPLAAAQIDGPGMCPLLLATSLELLPQRDPPMSDDDMHA